ncbi:MAG TPA: hypothetical protein VGF79_13790 [Bacteroidia bacterium]
MSERFDHSQLQVCPACGTEVRLWSRASNFLVCPVCNIKSAKQGFTLNRSDKADQIQEDLSPLCIGLKGEFNKRAFQIIGRQQLKFDGCIINVWQMLDDDNALFYVSESYAHYACLQEYSASNRVAPSDLVAGNMVMWDGVKSQFVESLMPLMIEHMEGEYKEIWKIQAKSEFAILSNKIGETALVHVDPYSMINVLKGKMIDFEDLNLKQTRNLNEW